MQKCKIAVVGFGQRGYCYVGMIRRTHNAELAAVCDTDAARMAAFASELNIENVPRFTSINEMLKGCDIDAVVITTPDFSHRDCAIACCKAGKHIMLEKPMAPTAAECRDIIRCCAENNCLMQVGFVLRFHPVFNKVIEIVRSGKLGQILNIVSNEYIGVMHGASYMRRWHRKTANSGGFVLAKCSHDLDIIATVADAKVRRVAAFGSLDFFTTDKLKHRYCSECPDEECRFRFKGEFVRMTPEEKADPSSKPFDLCVYNEDKDLVDHEVAIMDFDNGIKASFALHLFAEVPKRTISIAGTEGILYADTAEECIHVSYSNGMPAEKIPCPQLNNSGHGGSDQSFLDEFISCIQSGTAPRADHIAGLASTVIGNAIEKARMTDQVVEISGQEYEL